MPTLNALVKKNGIPSALLEYHKENGVGGLMK